MKEGSIEGMGQMREYVFGFLKGVSFSPLAKSQTEAEQKFVTPKTRSKWKRS